MVLSSGTAVFTSDRRVRIKSRSDTWILQIDPVLQKDDAFYECQVNTRNTMSLVFKINVERKYIEYPQKSVLKSPFQYNSADPFFGYIQVEFGFKGVENS